MQAIRLNEAAIPKLVSCLEDRYKPIKIQDIRQVSDNTVHVTFTTNSMFSIPDYAMKHVAVERNTVTVLMDLEQLNKDFNLNLEEDIETRITSLLEAKFKDCDAKVIDIREDEQYSCGDHIEYKVTLRYDPGKTFVNNMCFTVLSIRGDEITLLITKGDIYDLEDEEYTP